MKASIFAAVIIAASLTISAHAEDITRRVQEMRRFNEQQQAQQQRQQYQQYLKNNDAASGISQRTGPTGSLVKGGGTIGYQWSTK
jgi:hypothetical protein